MYPRRWVGKFSSPRKFVSVLSETDKARQEERTNRRGNDFIAINKKSSSSSSPFPSMEGPDLLLAGFPAAASLWSLPSFRTRVCVPFAAEHLLLLLLFPPVLGICPGLSEKRREIKRYCRRKEGKVEEAEGEGRMGMAEKSQKAKRYPPPFSRGWTDGRATTASMRATRRSLLRQ